MVAADCSAYPSLWEFFVSGDFVDGWICAMTGGDAATALLIFGVIFGGIEATLTNLALVAVLLLLGGLGLLVAYRSGS